MKELGNWAYVIFALVIVAIVGMVVGGYAIAHPTEKVDTTGELIWSVTEAPEQTSDDRVMVKVTVTNHGYDKAEIANYDFTYKSGQKTYGIDNMPDKTTLKDGQSKSYTLYFDTPNTSGSLKALNLYYSYHKG